MEDETEFQDDSQAGQFQVGNPAVGNRPLSAEEQTETTTEASDYYSAPMRQAQGGIEIGLMKELNPKKIMDDLEHYLLGEVYDFEQAKYIQKFDPIMNKTGINRFLMIAGGTINQVVTMSNFREDEIGRIVIFIMESSIPVIDINWKEFGIPDKTYLPTIHGMLFTMVLSSLKKAMNEGERRMVGRTINESIVSRPMQQTSQEMKKPSFLDRLNPFNQLGR